MTLVERMDARLYPRHGERWDDKLFREAILETVGPDQRVLDLGAGAGIVPEMNLRDAVARVDGVDPDPRVVGNPYLDEGRIGTGESIPYDDNSFDTVIADNVLEHLEDPERVFKEVARVLKPGGRFLAKTPNRRHYMPAIARLTPHSFHRMVNRMRGRRGEDTFPTRYRANSPGAVQRWAELSGLEVESTRLIEGRPEYLRMSPATYALGWAYERAVNTAPWLSGFRILLVASFVKPAEAPALVHRDQALAA